MSRAVLDLLLEVRRAEAAHEHDLERCFSRQLAQLDVFIARDEPVLFTLPAFPCKSPNPAKVLGHLPDLGELLALAGLQRLCERVAGVYEPGARMLVCSDGRVFADLIAVPDEDVTAYGLATRRIVEAEGFTRVGFFTLEDAYGDLDYPGKRRALVADHALPLEEIRRQVKSEERHLALYRGITRFLLEDARVPAYTGSTSALLRDARRRAYEVIQRSRAWSELIAHDVGHSVRLSIHPHPCGTSKFGIGLLGTADAWTTPWHAVAVRTTERVVLMRRDDAERVGRLVTVDGTPDSFVASEIDLARVPRQGRPH